jgi:hypothetical protein
LKYSVVTSGTWGTLPANLQAAWTTNDCNTVVAKGFKISHPNGKYLSVFGSGTSYNSRKGGFNITGYDSSVLGYDFSLTKTVSVSPSDPMAVVWKFLNYLSANGVAF